VTPLVAFGLGLLSGFLGRFTNRSAVVCASCVRSGDGARPGEFGDYSVCPRCERSVTSSTLAFRVVQHGLECPVCRTCHVDACPPDARAEVLREGPFR
jgi:hypothetical protein